MKYLFKFVWDGMDMPEYGYKFNFKKYEEGGFHITEDIKKAYKFSKLKTIIKQIQLNQNKYSYDILPHIEIYEG